MAVREDRQFISIDWGTTQFRMFLVNAIDTRILQGHSSADGIKSVHHAWRESNEDRELFFMKYITMQIHQWKEDLQGDEPIFVSGMASSSIGMRSLPYTRLPFSCDGDGLYIEQMQLSQTSHPLFLISGVRSDLDVMRGEETQLVGLTKNRDQSDLILLLPGTHSKHVSIQNAMVIEFETYMTGETFEVLSRHSILKESLQKGDLNDLMIEAFLGGVSQSGKCSFLNDLFKLRAKDLFGQSSKEENYFFLSGLLIGQELRNLLPASKKVIQMGATGELAILYGLAVKQLKLATTILPEELIKRAVISGHQKLFQQIVNS